jgi:hypothetical protein
MLSQEHISIGRLKQAYKLNAQDEEALIASLAERDCIDLYYSWREAECYFWAKEHPEARDVAGKYFPGVADLGNDLLQERYATKRMLRYFMNLARIEDPMELLQKRFERVLQVTYDDSDGSYSYVVELILNMIYEERYFRGGRGRVELDDIMTFSASPGLFVNFCNFFDDAIIVDKRVAVRHLLSCGYSLKEEVKGISKAYVELVQPTLSIHSPQNTLVNPSDSTVFVPRKLWADTTPSTVRDCMRGQYPDSVIAYVLHNWCGLTNKTQIGRLLGPDRRDDSTYLRLAHRLLTEVASLNIQQQD